MTLVACTIVTRSFLAHARVLAVSLAEYNPGARLWALVIDDPGATDPLREPFESIRGSELSLDRREFHRMATIYNAAELSVALRPWVIRHVLDGGVPSVLWLDADVEVFGPLEDIVELTERHGIVLTPSTHEPIPRDGRTPDEIEILRAGPFSGGLIGVSAAARPFLDWWAEPLRRDCIFDPARGLFREKNWLTFAPSYFDHHVLSDPGVDVVYWNLHRRQLEWTGERYEVDAKPLRSFHFTGFDPNRPGRVSRHQGPSPRIEPVDYPALARVCREYADRLFAAGYGECAKVSYGFDEAANGLRLTQRIRRLYRGALVEEERSGGPDLPNPFEPAEAPEFLRWLGDPARIHPMSSAERAAFLIERGPLPTASMRFGPPARWLRSLVLRALRHYGDHQREVDRALLQAVRDLDSRVGAVGTESGDSPADERA